MEHGRWACLPGSFDVVRALQTFPSNNRLGIPEIEAKRYEHGISQGNFLISVHVTNEAEVKRAKDILAHEQASDIAVTSMAGA